MGTVNQATLDDANRTFQAKFEEIFAQGTPGLHGLYTEVMQTDSISNSLVVLETRPIMREWIGSKVFNSVRASSLTIDCKPYEKSLAWQRINLRGDKIGALARAISSFMSGDGAQIYDQILFPFLISNTGAGPTCYDGKALFATDHPRSSGTTWSNKSTTALSFAQFDSLVSAGAGRTDDNGEPLGIAFDTLVVGPKLQRLGMEITQSTERFTAIDSAGAQDSGTRLAVTTIPNVYGGGQMTLVVDPRLVGTYDDYYYLLDTKRGPKPLVAFELEAPHAETMDSMSDNRRFERDEVAFSVECYLGVGAGAPQVAYAGIL